MHQYHIWLYLLQHITHTDEHTCCYIIKVLSLLHDIQIIIRLDVEYLQYLVKHFTVLTGHTNNSLKFTGFFLKRLHQRSHFYSFGTSTEDQHYLLHLYYKLSEILSIQFFSQCIYVTMTIFQIRFHIVTLSPFIP